jgi:hypothetical protein
LSALLRKAIDAVKANQMPRETRNSWRKQIQGKCGVEALSSQLSSGFAPEKLIRQFESTCAGAAHSVRREKPIPQQETIGGDQLILRS